MNSILFISPDYHCSFFYRDEFRKMGWRADIFVPKDYPRKLLYSEKDILCAPSLKGNGQIRKYVNILMNTFFYLTIFWKYQYHFHYGALPPFYFFEHHLFIEKLLGKNFSISLWLAKLFKKKIIYLPTGCHDTELRKYFTALDEGNICNNCGYSDRCDDDNNTKQFNIIRKYADMCIGTGEFETSQFRQIHFKYKAIDLNLWHPEIEIPIKHKLPPSENIRILHSFYTGGRDYKDRNIKGSPFVLAAIERLKKEGHKVEYIYSNDIPSRDMRFYQVQADIVVEQLIYGWWGSTGVETMALGKPVVCYIRPTWKNNFLKIFPEYDELPIVEADTSNIYEVLKKLITDHEYRLLMGKKSRQFAEQHFDSEKNAKALSNLLRTL